MGDRRPSASSVWFEPIEVNRSGCGVESCTRAYDEDIVGEYAGQTRGDKI